MRFDRVGEASSNLMGLLPHQLGDLDSELHVCRWFVVFSFSQTDSSGLTSDIGKQNDVSVTACTFSSSSTSYLFVNFTQNFDISM